MSNFSLPYKVKLANLPTPIQRLNWFSEKLSKTREVNIFVKRDDINHGPAAGNKIRKLEYLFGEALSKKMKTVFTCGGLQSNHARATAILAKQLGLDCVLFLRGDKPKSPEEVHGNLLLNKMLGTKIEYIDQNAYDNIAKTFFDAAEVYRKRDGRNPLFIPVGGSNDIGTLGYIEAFQEIEKQCGINGVPNCFDNVVVANGSGGTHAGLLIGKTGTSHEDHCTIVSFNVCNTSEVMSDAVKNVALSTIQRNHIPVSFMPSEIRVLDGYVGPGYAQATDEIYDFILEFTKHEGIFLDPVYTGKAMLGLQSEIEKGNSVFGKNILFIHTGGFPSLFAHKNFSERLL